MTASAVAELLLADIFDGDETVLCGTSEVLINLFNKSVFALNDLVEIVLLDLNLFISVLVIWHGFIVNLKVIKLDFYSL